MGAIRGAGPFGSCEGEEGGEADKPRAAREWGIDRGGAQREPRRGCAGSEASAAPPRTCRQKAEVSPAIKYAEPQLDFDWILGPRQVAESACYVRVNEIDPCAPEAPECASATAGYT